MTEADKHWMARALTLARRGGFGTAPNPQVGCVIVSASGQFLSEGWHEKPGEPHAEIQALNRVDAKDRAAIKGATFYVTLEPCAHVGKTPPCADRLVAEQAGRVVVAVSDPFPAVNGLGIQRLRDAGIQVDVGLFADEAVAINERFWVNTLQRRPWITLKWAESADGYMDPRPAAQRISGAGGFPITGDLAQTVVHALRAQHHSILVGRKTAEVDEPMLNNRLAPGGSPIRWVVENRRKLDANHPFIVNGGRRIDDLSTETFMSLFLNHGVHSLLVEGGGEVLQYIIDHAAVDEVVILRNPKLLRGGLAAPKLPAGFAVAREVRLQDDLALYMRKTDDSPSYS